MGRKRKPDVIVSRVIGDLGELVNLEDPTVNKDVARSMQRMAKSLLQEPSYVTVVMKVVEKAHGNTDKKKL